jgi:hypothetical protein
MKLERLEGIGERFAALMASIDIDEFVQRTWTTAERVAQSGWTLPRHLSSPELEDLVEMSTAADGRLEHEKVDAFLVAHYTADDHTVLRRVQTELLLKPTLSRWRKLLNECFEVFYKGKHVITVPALLSIIEGIISSEEKAGNTNVGQKFLIGICARKAKASRTIKGAGWRSLEVFIEKLFAPVPFDSTRPNLINRNWILHGRDRDTANWTIADSIRLFNAVQTLDFAAAAAKKGDNTP